jgi:hypothetical protein
MVTKLNEVLWVGLVSLLKREIHTQRQTNI